MILVVKESLKKQRTVKHHVNSVQHGHFGHHGHLAQLHVASESKIRDGSFLYFALISAFIKTENNPVRLENVTTVVLANLTVLVLLQRPVNAMELDENVNIGDHGKVGIHARSHVVKESPDEHGHV